jgi:hypothetical protein
MFLCPFKLTVRALGRCNKIKGITVFQPYHIVLSVEALGQGSSTLHVDKMGEMGHERVMPFLDQFDTNVNCSNGVLVGFSHSVV